ncbi:MAG: DNA-binding protein [Mesorhizobium sp.]|nr:MAG: DNA-binding protein [Mesorhizobium sp.]
MAPSIFIDEDDPLLSHKEALAYLGFKHPNTLYNFKSQGRGPRVTKIAGHSGYRTSDLMVWQLDRYLAKVAEAVAA